MIGKNIAALRKIKGLNQSDLAKAIHVTQSAVSQWETGRTQPDMQQIYILADFFGVSVSVLADENGIIPSGLIKYDKNEVEEAIKQPMISPSRFGPETQKVINELLAKLRAMPDKKQEEAARGALTYVRGVVSADEQEGKA